MYTFVFLSITFVVYHTSGPIVFFASASFDVRVRVCVGGISIFIQTDQNKSIMVLSQFKDFGSIHSRQSIKNE